MNYEDFPILSNTDYALLKQKLAPPKQDRAEAIEQIVSLLNSFSTCCLSPKKLNSKIINAINEAKNVCTKHQNNLSALFNTSTTCREIETINLFAMIKKLLVASSELSSVAADEEKVYYKKIFIQTSKDLIIAASTILSALQESNVITFNHM